MRWRASRTSRSTGGGCTAPFGAASSRSCERSLVRASPAWSATSPPSKRSSSRTTETGRHRRLNRSPLPERPMFLIGLRLHAWGIAAWGGLFALLGALQVSGFHGIMGGSAIDKVAFSQQIEEVGRRTSLFLPPPEHIDTLPGYLAWFLFGYFELFSIWALVAGTSVIRGEEERGLLETWLAAGIPRWRLVIDRTMALDR